MPPRLRVPHPPRPFPSSSTDIGDDIDDTWALVMLLKSPSLDVRLITTDYGDTVYRARIVARLLEIAGRTDIPIGIGTRENVDLKGDRYARVRDSKDPLLQALIENYRLWCPRNEWCAKDPGQVEAKSSTLFDTVAVYLAEARDLVKTETLGVRVNDEGMTLIDEGAPALAWATEWESLEDFEELLVERLTGTVVAR